MLDKFNVKSYAWSNDVYFDGVEIYRRGGAVITCAESKGENRLTVVHADVTGDDGTVYQCTAALSAASETVMAVKCTCPEKCDAFGYCRHVCAALLTYIDKRNDPGFASKSFSSPAVRTLISDYSRLAAAEAGSECGTCPAAVLEPVLTDRSGKLFLEFRIGSKKKYVVKSICRLLNDFNFRSTVTYGKDFTFLHDRLLLDETSRRLLGLAVMYFQMRPYSNYGAGDRYIPLAGRLTEEFFDIVKGSEVDFRGKLCRVSDEDPRPCISLKKRRKSDAFHISLKEKYTFFFSEEHCCAFDENTDTFHICSVGFTRKAVPLLDAAAKNGGSIDIAKSDMTQFYSSVISSVEKYVSVDIACDISEHIPPEAETALYLDTPAADEVCGRLEFTYGAQHYSAFSGGAAREYRDIRKETAAEYAVLKYFTADSADPHHPLKVTGADDIYRLLSEGLPELTKQMDIYASERFESMRIRPPVYPSVGVRPEGGLLALDIDADGYDISELAEMLSAYRRGMKYHRLRSGSFIDLTGGGIAEFAELADGLALSDKALLKKQITVPRCRMLYLDSLRQEEGSIRIRRSAGFKQAMKDFSDIASSEYPVPAGLEDIMREYQIYGYRWMRTIAAYGFGGILADDMGLGKTLQAIALMLALKQEDERNGREHRADLVVCPSSLTLNWKSEIERFAPTMKAAVISGSALQRTELIAGAADADVMITSYSMITRDIPDYADIHFRCQFIDEAQFIKNHNTQAAKAVKAVRSDIRFALTGTPVENSLAELWSIYDFVMPEYLFNYNHFKKTYETPIVRGADERSAGALKRLTSPFILRRLKKDVLTELPDKTEISLSAEMTEEQEKLYAANVLSMKDALGEGSFDDGRGHIEILAMLTRLRQICCDPALVYENYSGGSGKLEQCLELVESCINSGHKLLLFSQFTSMLDIIAARLGKAGIRYYMLTGSTKAEERLRLVNTFNSDDTPVFMISLKAGGTGLNLTGADIVIHFDPWWNISAENQATDRAYRIGQRSNVTVYRLITKNTIEERITELQKSKSGLAELAVGGDGGIMRMKPAEIMKILDQ